MEFSSEDQAIVHAISSAFHNADSNSREYGGWIYKYNGYYKYDQYAASDSNEIMGRISARAPAGPAVAFYHTHPNNDGVSNQDIQGFLQLGVRYKGARAYIGQPNGGIYMVDVITSPATFRHVAGPAYSGIRRWEYLR